MNDRGAPVQSSQRDITETPTLAEATRVWGKIGLLSFGGPAAQIGLMHRLVVDEKRWLSEAQFLNALSFCMLLPGPEAMQLATYTGWRLHGMAGGLVAGSLFVLPGALVMLVLALIYVWFGEVATVSALFSGIKAAITVIVLQAVIKLAGKALRDRAQTVIALCGFIGIFLLQLPFPLIIGLAAIWGWTRHCKVPRTPFNAPLPSPVNTVKTIGLWLAVWWLPLFAIDFAVGSGILASIGYFFSKLAIVTFGGAYAVLAYMAQDVAGQLGWLSPAAMMDGLGLAETTPGPLILVTEFVGFVAAYGAGGLWHGVAGALIALWATFIPCFLWIFAGAPYVDWLTKQPPLQGALSSIMAAVVGVIANLFLWFSLHVLFGRISAFQAGPLRVLMPDPASLDWRVLLIAMICGWMGLFRGMNLFWILSVAAIGAIGFGYFGAAS